MRMISIMLHISPSLRTSFQIIRSKENNKPLGPKMLELITLYSAMITMMDIKPTTRMITSRKTQKITGSGPVT